MSREDPKLILVCGLPGSGKTTLSKKLESQLSAVRYCPDERMQELGISLFSSKHRAKIEKEMWNAGQDLLKGGQTIIVEFGSWSKSERLELLRGAQELNVGVDLYLLDPPIAELKSRLRKRGAEGDEKLLDGQELEKANKSFQRPTSDELNLYDTYQIMT
jgi:predicted kinase